MTMLPLTEMFVSVQGETSFCGLPTFFVRTAACNLRCTWCDTTYSFGRGMPTPLEEIEERIAESGVKHVCITGGEPLLHQESLELMQRLVENGYTVSLETSGSLPIDRVDPRVHVILDLKCPGSGMEAKNDWTNIAALLPHHEVKFVIKDRLDYDWSKEVMQRHHLPNVLFAPVFEELPSKQLVEWILADKLAVRLNLQTHKFIWDPQTKGV